jgi:hypothetical protein
LFAFSNVDFGLVFKELNIGVSDFKLFVRLKDEAQELFFDDGFGQLRVIFGFPVPGIGVPDRTCSFGFAHFDYIKSKQLI